MPTEICPTPRWKVPLLGNYPSNPVPKPPPKKPTKGAFYPPKHEIQSFARCILPAIQAYFESDKGKQEYAEWCKKRRQEADKTA
ncbi:MAG: hypothetical protein LBS74_00285 [Oscillospiraceae bacterium]|jgi:hypothetical protein|nr:hypothetical protein [Oscillospiraceae bacterium]